MSNLAIHITVEPESGRPVSLARISDSDTLRYVARAALTEARANALHARNRDSVLGFLEDDEVSRLERYFSLLIPGFAADRPAHLVF